MAIENKVQRVEKHLRRMILRGQLVPGTRLPAEYRFTSKFRVSQRTIREALIRLENDGLVERRQGSGTYVLENTQTANVAVLASVEKLSSPAGYFYRRLVEEAKKRIAGAGYRFVLSVGHGQVTEEFASSIHLLDRPNAKETLGVLSTVNLGPLEQQFAEAGIHAVSIAAAAPGGKYSVVLDYAHLTELGTELLNSRGYDDFVLMYVEFPLDKYDTDMIAAERRIHLKAVGDDQRRLVAVPPALKFEQAYEAISELWSRPDRPRAIFFHDDALCDVCTRAILELGIRVPDELAILTHANVGRRFEFPVKLTCIEFDPAEVAAAGCEMLEKLIAQKPVDENTVYLKASIREGDSLGNTSTMSSTQIGDT